MGDSNVPNTGKVYYKMFKLVETLKQCAADNDTYEDAKTLHEKAANRWNFMFQPFHGAGACVFVAPCTTELCCTHTLCACVELVGCDRDFSRACILRAPLSYH